MRVYRNESDVIKHIKDILKNLPNTYFNKFSDRYKSGFPDLLLGNQGKYAFVEVKHGKLHSKFAPIQVATIYDMQKAGIRAYGLMGVSEKEVRTVDFSAFYAKVSGAISLAEALARLVG